MSAIVGTADAVEEVARVHAPEQALSAGGAEKEVAPATEKEVMVDDAKTPEAHVYHDGREYPTEEEERTLRRVSDQVPWTAYTIAFVELCERFSYYGTIAVCMLTSCRRSCQSGKLTMQSTKSPTSSSNHFLPDLRPVRATTVSPVLWTRGSEPPQDCPSVSDLVPGELL